MIYRPPSSSIDKNCTYAIDWRCFLRLSLVIWHTCLLTEFFTELWLKFYLREEICAFICWNLPCILLYFHIWCRSSFPYDNGNFWPLNILAIIKAQFNRISFEKSKLCVHKFLIVLTLIFWQMREPIFGKQFRSEFELAWNKAVDQTFGPLVASLNSRRH